MSTHEETEHTPLPLRVSNGAVIDGSDRIVCVVACNSKRGADGCHELANLFAASPEMFDALEAAEAALATATQTNGVRTASQRVIAALAKAKGGV